MARTLKSGTSIDLTASGSVAAELRKRIVRGGILGGERVMQDAVAKEFGVSQTIAREAFKQLEGEGFILIEPRKGAHVRKLSSAEAREITALRSLIEAQALAWAIPRLTKTDLSAAEAVLDRLDKAKRVQDLIALNATFHEKLYAPCEADRTLALVSELRLSFERYLRFTWKETPHRAKSQREHREILALCRDRNIDKACSLLKQHIEGTGNVLADRLAAREMESSSPKIES